MERSKKVHWYHEGQKYTGTAYMTKPDAFSEYKHIWIDEDEFPHEMIHGLYEDEITNGETIEEIFEKIPEDITDWELK